MQEDEKKVDVGDNDEQETTIDLDAPAPEQSLEEQIDVEEIKEDDIQPDNTATESDVSKDVQKDELNEYSEGVNKRIAKLTRKMREAERQKEEAISYAQSIQQEAASLKNRYDNLGTNYTKELEGKVTAGLAAAKAEYKIAVDAGDIDRQVESQKAIAQIAMEENRLKQIQHHQEQRLKRAPQQAPQNYSQVAEQMPTSQDIYQAAQTIDPKAEDWSAKNAWFGTDNAMTYTAFDIHRKLVEDEGFDPQTPEYYSEVDKRIRLEFPHKFDSVERSTGQPAQNVASAKRPATKGRRKTVKLTPSQVAISKRLGVPLEEYAKQLAAKEV